MSMFLFILAAAASTTPLDRSREAYELCLNKLTIDMLAEKKTAEEFGEAAKTACESEKANFHAAVVKDERSMGSSAAEASEFADEEVATVLEDMGLLYADHVEYKSTPVIK